MGNSIQLVIQKCRLVLKIREKNNQKLKK